MSEQDLEYFDIPEINKSGKVPVTLPVSKSTVKSTSKGTSSRPNSPSKILSPRSSGRGWSIKGRLLRDGYTEQDASYVADWAEVINDGNTMNELTTEQIARRVRDYIVTILTGYYPSYNTEKVVDAILQMEIGKVRETVTPLLKKASIMDFVLIFDPNLYDRFNKMGLEALEKEIAGKIGEVYDRYGYKDDDDYGTLVDWLEEQGAEYAVDFVESLPYERDIKLGYLSAIKQRIDANMGQEEGEDEGQVEEDQEEQVEEEDEEQVEGNIDEDIEELLG